MGIGYYWWVFRRTLMQTVMFFSVMLIGWLVIVGHRSYMHFLVDIGVLWAMLFVAHASRYKVKDRYYRDVAYR